MQKARKGLFCQCRRKESYRKHCHVRLNPEGNCGNDDNNLQSDAGQLQLSIAVHLFRQTSDLKCPLAFAINFREKNNVSEINGQIRHLYTSDSDRINNIMTKISEQEDNFRV